MEIFAAPIERELPDLVKQGVRVRFLGRRDRTPDELRARLDAGADASRTNDPPTPLGEIDLGCPATLAPAPRPEGAPATHSPPAGGHASPALRA